MLMTQEIIDKAKANDACKDGIWWGQALIGQEVTPDNAEPGYVLWLCSIDIVAEPELLDWCIEYEPMAALEYAHKYLSSEQFDWCVKQEPYATDKNIG